MLYIGMRLYIGMFQNLRRSKIVGPTVYLFVKGENGEAAVVTATLISLLQLCKRQVRIACVGSILAGLPCTTNHSKYLDIIFKKGCKDHKRHIHMVQSVHSPEPSAQIAQK